MSGLIYYKSGCFFSFYICLHSVLDGSGHFSLAFYLLCFSLFALRLEANFWVCRLVGNHLNFETSLYLKWNLSMFLFAYVKLSIQCSSKCLSSKILQGGSCLEHLLYKILLSATTLLPSAAPFYFLSPPPLVCLDPPFLYQGISLYGIHHQCWPQSLWGPSAGSDVMLGGGPH